VAEHAFVVIYILEGMPGCLNPDFGAELLKEFAAEDVLSCLAVVDGSTEGTNALHPAVIRLDLGSQEQTGAPCKSDRLCTSGIGETPDADVLLPIAQAGTFTP
jgi:hypothetical protein